MAVNNHTIINEYEQMLEFHEYANLAFAHGYTSLGTLALDILMPMTRLWNMQQKKISVKEADKRYFWLDAKIRGWI